MTKLFATFIFSIALVGTWHSSTAQLEAIKTHYKKIEKQAKDAPATIQFIQQEMDLVADFSSLNQIILLRHGEPVLNKTGWRKRKEAIRFVAQYDSANVYTPEHVPVHLTDHEIDVLFTSTLNRSISTAAQLFPEFKDQRSAYLFREFERKVFSFFNVKLPLKWWTTGSRVFWLMGFNKKGIESFSEAKQRAQEAVVFLEKNASENGKTLLVSHGLLNHYLAKYLKKNGWTEVFDGGKGYLSQKLLVKYHSPQSLPNKYPD